MAERWEQSVEQQKRQQVATAGVHCRRGGGRCLDEAGHFRAVARGRRIPPLSDATRLWVGGEPGGGRCPSLTFHCCSLPFLVCFTANPWLFTAILFGKCIGVPLPRRRGYSVHYMRASSIVLPAIGDSPGGLPNVNPLTGQHSKEQTYLQVRGRSFEGRA